MSDVDTLFASLFTNEDAIVSTSKTGNSWRITLDPTAMDRVIERRIYNKAEVLRTRYPAYGVVFEYENDDNTFGPIGRHGAGTPTF